MASMMTLWDSLRTGATQFDAYPTETLRALCQWNDRDGLWTAEACAADPDSGCGAATREQCIDSLTIWFREANTFCVTLQNAPHYVRATWLDGAIVAHIFETMPDSNGRRSERHCDTVTVDPKHGWASVSAQLHAWFKSAEGN